MATQEHNLSRRTALAAIAGGTAIAAVPLAAANLAPIGAARWDAALAAFREVERQHKVLWDRWEAACDAAADCTPERVARYFDDYRLGIGMSRNDVEYWLRLYNTGRTDRRIDVGSTADEFMTYQQKFLDAHERYQTDRLYNEAQAQNPAYQEARDALMAVPAPTIAALLVKIEIAAVSLDDDHADSMLADARRLLGREA